MIPYPYSQIISRGTARSRRSSLSLSSLIQVFINSQNLTHSISNGILPNLWSDLLMLLEYLPAVRLGFLVLFTCTPCRKWLKVAKAASSLVFSLIDGSLSEDFLQFVFVLFLFLSLLSSLSSLFYLDPPEKPLDVSLKQSLW